MLAYKSKSLTLVHGVIAPEAFKNIGISRDDAVILCEGRPSLAAGKMNAKSFLKMGITPTVICDNMAGFLFYKGWVKDVYLACQFADKSGALCDCGGLMYAVLAKVHKVPVRLIQGELKSRFLGDPNDISVFEGARVAPDKTQGYVPLVEWVPSKYL